MEAAVKGQASPHHELINFLNNNELLRNRWRITFQLHSGRWSSVFRAEDMKLRDVVVIKSQAPEIDDKWLALETQVLRQLQQSAHVPRLYGSGKINRSSFVVMQRLSDSLDRIRQQSPFGRLTLSAVFRLWHQGIRALRDMHEKRLFHRNLHPGHIAVGVGMGQKHRLFIMDFSSVRCNPPNSKPRTDVKFQGSIRYASLSAHRSLELGAVDDLWSLLYSMVELVNGHLPWRRHSSPNHIKELKMSSINADLCEGLPPSIAVMPKYLTKLTYFATPPYEEYQAMIRKAMADLHIDWNDSYDWDTQFRHVTDEHRILPAYAIGNH